uniref:Uncharacterized protein n=1 Tax=Cannabis sativa TaxID=3483 RepID=A0A803QRY4_CANSA
FGFEIETGCFLVRTGLCVPIHVPCLGLEFRFGFGSLSMFGFGILVRLPMPGLG